ncbi:MAG TPA: hypothetical protein VG944_01105 [Fimbriimonas sp.]|nr:hypothetical protein [Fimbriimonas sp.]
MAEPMSDKEANVCAITLGLGIVLELVAICVFPFAPIAALGHGPDSEPNCLVLFLTSLAFALFGTTSLVVSSANWLNPKRVLGRIAQGFGWILIAVAAYLLGAWIFFVIPLMWFSWFIGGSHTATGTSEPPGFLPPWQLLALWLLLVVLASTLTIWGTRVKRAKPDGHACPTFAGVTEADERS